MIKTRKRMRFIVLVVALIFALSAVMLTACEDKPESSGGSSGGSGNSSAVDEGDICNGIEIIDMPTKLTYKTGEKFTPAGLTFNATYENGYVEEDLTAGDLDGWTPSAAFTSWGEVNVTLVFEGFEKVITVTVEPKTLESMYIKTEPSVLTYSVGNTIDFGGMDVMAKYAEDDAEVNETNYTVTDADGNTYVSGETVLNTPGTIELRVTITAGQTSMSDTFAIEVINGFSVQVEDTAGDPAPTDESYTVINNANINSNLPCTGSEGKTPMYCGDLYAGSYMEFHIYSATAVENAELVLVAASTLLGDGRMNDMVLSDIFEMYVDGDLVAFEDEVILPGQPFPAAGSNANRWAMWENVSLGTIDLNAGYTVVRLLCVNTPKDANGDYRAGNFDRLDVVFPEVIENPCTGIEITTMPETEYVEGETFDPTGIVFTATYADGSTVEGLTADDITWNPKRALTTSDRTVTITHDGFDKDIAINVAFSGTVTVQAEASGSHGETESYTVLTPVQSGEGIRVNSGAKGSEGTGCVESVAQGDTLTFHVYAPQAGTYDLSVRTCSTLRRTDNTGNLSVDFAEMYSVSVGGVPMELENAVIPELDLPSGASIWFNWYDLALGSVTLEAGYNVITFECIGTATDHDGSARTPNFDCIDLVYSADEA